MLMHILHSSIDQRGIVQLQHHPTYWVQQGRTQPQQMNSKDEQMTYNTETGFASISLGQRFATLRAEWAEKAARRKVFRATFKELNALSDRDLADLGLHRSAIKRVAWEAAELK